MEVICTRPHCPRPRNQCLDLDDSNRLTSIEQKYCITCGMPLILGGRYLPERLLGQGGFGAAFLAVDRYSPKKAKCVIKQFQPSGNLSPQALEKAKNLFFQEAHVLEDLGREHPQIPDLYAFFPLKVKNQLTGEEEQFFYLAQEYIDGKNLEEILQQQQKPFQEGEVKNILKELLLILKFIHENGSIHRDIKPSNIMLSKNGRLYLLDFGAVKQATNNPSNTQEKSTTIYSAGFAPPEQQLGNQVSAATDLYALAATCVILLTNRDPDDLYDPQKKVWNWQNYAPNISSDLVRVFNKMLLANPRDRFQSSEEVLTALNTSPPSPPPSPIPPSSPVMRKSSRFSLGETFANAAFTGFEGTLLVIALNSLVPSAGIVIAFMILGGLVLALFKKVIEGKDLPIIAAITLAFLLIPQLQGTLSFPEIAIIAVMAAIGAIAITAFFRLIYQIILRLF
ncbi:MAG: serine/threonine protein kinase [Microcystis panniformis Mp_MB_F_20051200_S9]|uniref:non-specific serine/threonine protein kinase n=1 Tax=Microcystis panniformis Mp_MB_F_20051200_S9 TaxID=2486223 RepID=A0A552Q204_9CHRO|nr:MAG: serine/threonine protein kinase [Microcystis panniformis Mp_GB_SS_20050300_S99D]TRV44083.1 MAG: serine/threonine protein kinase [Microcystis panniformis Mp_GB_SS_20050300_S99]TRV44493.1 MAG: serine/threonine protein kinase [Microcystis panniformis Mp_MB_F_20080800_S26D]TRV56701.1 MAG: serine/threonine protein kinase [Microcystis panniformis Mp_MB_F_20051200_S9D]TRV60963.1 MAG: serine/threonine protein kinase [Microcystis panniformis Mp_MB_F_20080800_S26]TRV63251.1 MAG: serine/threonine